jgi:predicted ATP-grasp superfamily ATP-dependent carboligase
MRYIIKAILYSILVIFLLLIISLIFSKLPFFLNIYQNNNSNNILVLSNHNGYMLENIYHNGVCIWAYYILFEFIKKRYKKKNFKLYFKSIKKNTRINKFIKYVKKYKIKHIIPTESKNVMYLSKHKKKLEKYAHAIIPDNYKIVKELDDKYSCFLFCKKHNIPTPNTVCINKIKKKELNNFIKNNKFPLYLKKTFDTNGSLDVHKIDDDNMLNNKLKNIRGKWILQANLEHNHASIDVLYYKGNIISVTMHSHKWHTDMRSISSEYFFPTIYSFETHIAISPKYVNNIMKIVKDVGIHSNYSGIMNIDILIHKGQPYLLEINPRFSGSIYISINTSLLNDYFNLLLKKKINIQKSPNIDYQQNIIQKASEVKDFSIVPFCIENLGVILSVDKLDVNTYATI